MCRSENMSELEEKIKALCASPEYNDYLRIHKDNIFSITRTLRQESMHSSFLSWLLDSTSKHELGDFPIKSFLNGLLIVKTKSENANAQLNDDLKKTIIECVNNDKIKLETDIQVEFNIISPISNKRGRLDILIIINFTDKSINKKLPVIIENKVNSFENKQQTKLYYEWAEKKYDREHYYDPIYVFLIPSWNKYKPSQNEFICFLYQDLVDYVIEPSINKSSNHKVIDNLKMYLHCLSYQIDSKKGDRSMATSREEKDIINNFYKNNKQLFIEMITKMNEDENIDPLIVETVDKLASHRDNSKYEFDGKIYNQRSKLVFAVVNKYNDENKPNSVDELKKAFAVYNMIRSIDEAPESWSNNKTVTTTDNMKAVIDNIWGTEYIEGFIDYVKKEHGYIINKIS